MAPAIKPGGIAGAKKLWQRTGTLHQAVEAFTVGKDFILDNRLIKYDCQATIAHAEMLGKMGILSEAEVGETTEQLNKIIRMHGEGNFQLTPGEEDCHTKIENFLTEKLGQTGKKIHSFRSRNDQVLTALHLYYRDELSDCECLLGDFFASLYHFKSRYQKVQLPGFTHTRKAMPSTVGTWAGAYLEAIKDNLKMIQQTYQLVDQSPLGSGAGYGVPGDIDRQFTADRLGFDRIQENPVYSQTSRGKFAAVILHTLSMVMLDLNKLASDLIFFTLPEFSFFHIPSQFLTGSSMMPHKKNPDVLELLRSHYHQLVSYEIQVKSISSNLISGYHRDMQLTKEPVMTGFEITKSSLKMADLIISHLQVQEEKCREAMTEEVFATERVYQMVIQGIPFRDAYHTIARKYGHETFKTDL